MRRLRALLVVSLLAFICIGDVRVPGVLAQDFDPEPFFKPLVEPSPTRKPSGPPAVFSFSRFEGSLRALCQEIEVDGRREVLVRVATREAARKDDTCISCRALWRTVLSACAKLGPKPTPALKLNTPKVTATAVAEGVPTDVTEGGEATPTSVPVPPTPTPKQKPRAPSTTALDIASRISSTAYDADSGGGGVTRAFQNMVTTVMSSKDLSVAEREYYETLFTFLMAAWQGRERSDGDVVPTPEVNVDEFFEY